MSLGHLYILLGEVSLQVLCPFFNWVVCLPRVELCEFFIYFGDQTLVQGVIGKYVFPYSWVSFHFNAVFFSCTEAFYFDEVPFIYAFLYVPCSRRRIGENSVEYLRFSCLCSPLGLLWCHNLYLSLLSTLNLFLCMVKLVLEFHFSACSCPALPTPFVEEAICTAFYTAAPFVEN